MQAGWCRSKNKPLISARPHLASAQLPVSSSLGRQSYGNEMKKKKEKFAFIFCCLCKSLERKKIFFIVRDD
jgi:hypothetical protein